MKVGRNDPCPCGSGKKYKKCCLLKQKVKSPTIPAEVIKKFEEHRKNETRGKQLYGQTRSIIHADFQGYKFVAVGSELYHSNKWKVFPDFLMEYIIKVLGRDWANSELRKLFKEKHQIFKWYDGVCRFQQSQTADENGIFRVIPNGMVAAYFLLAYDLYILGHHKSIQKDVVRRLKHPDQFQGARYELFVASTCIRAGFDIEFENEKDGSKKHAEFIATHKITGQKISVEAKSKHRKGVLGQQGEERCDDELRVRVGSLLNQALKKESIYPLVIFIDVNVPLVVAQRIFKTPLPNYVSEILDKVNKTDTGKDIFNLILFTNHPHHYGREDEPDPGKNVFSAFPLKPNVIPGYPQTILDINEAALQYGKIPNEFPDT